MFVSIPADKVLGPITYDDDSAPDLIINTDLIAFARGRRAYRHHRRDPIITLIEGWEFYVRHTKVGLKLDIREVR